MANIPASQIKLTIKDLTGLIFNTVTVIIDSETPINSYIDANKPIYKFMALAFPNNNVLGPFKEGGYIRILNHVNDTIFEVYTEIL